MSVVKGSDLSRYLLLSTTLKFQKKPVKSFGQVQASVSYSSIELKFRQQNDLDVGYLDIKMIFTLLEIAVSD